MGTLNGNLKWKLWIETLDGNLVKKTPNPMRETEEENRETSENILAP